MNTNAATPSTSGTRTRIRRRSILTMKAMGSGALGLEHVDARVRLRADAGQLLRIPGGHQLGVDDGVEDRLLGDEIKIFLDLRGLGRLVGLFGGLVHLGEQALGVL